MRGRVELPNVEHVALVFQDGGLIVVHVEVVGGGEKSHHGWETGCSGLAIHPVPDKHQTF